MTYSVDGMIDGCLVDSSLMGHLSRLCGFLAPLPFFFLSEQLTKKLAFFLRKLLDSMQDVVNGCSAHGVLRGLSKSSISYPHRRA